MIATSMKYKKAIHVNRNMSIHDTFAFADGSKPSISTGDFMQYGINEAVSGSSSFVIGAAVIKKYTAALNNMEEKFSAYDFEGLNISAMIGLELEDKTTEILKKGNYRCVKAAINENTISIEAYDSMLFFDRPYSESTLVYPATICSIVEDACTNCQVPLDAKSLRNNPMSNYVVKERPEDKNLTFRDIISFCAQIMCCFARINHLDSLTFGWYDFETLEKLHDEYDGGNFENYSSGDSVDGGNFKDYSSGDSVNGGLFEEQKKYHHFYSLGSQNINTDDIQITGIKVTATKGKKEQEKEESFLYGGEGYVISIEKNPLIQTGKAKEVAEYIGRQMVGKRFRPLSISCQSDPCIEAGDCACVTDRKQRTFFTVISNTTFAFGSTQAVECTAETPTEKNYVKYSAITKAIDEADENADRKLSEYDVAVQQLTNLMSQSFGVFKSEEVLEDGSVIYYMHDKPERANSSTIWKMTADAFAVSTDGGKTWNAGMDSSGNAVVNVLNAIGINADWVNTGCLKSITIDNGNGAFTVDRDGNVKILKGSINIGNGAFTVDKDGNMVSNSGKFVGEITGSIIQLGDNFRAYSDGTIRAKRGNLGPWEFFENTFMTNDYKLQITKQDDSSWFINSHEGSLWVKEIIATGNTSISGNLQVIGTKNRIVSTDNYDKRLLYCYETPSPMFGDIGEGQLDDTGKCIIFIDDVFAETVDTDCQYQVFLQNYGDGNAYVSERTPSYFIVCGTPNMKFAWELKAVQKEYDTMRLERFENDSDTESTGGSAESTYNYLTSLLYDVESEDVA